MKLRPILTAAALFISPILCHGMFMLPETVPVAKLVASVGKTVEAEPKNADAHFTLGRIHFLAFAEATANLKIHTARGEERLPFFPHYSKLTSAGESAIYAESEKRTLAELRLTKTPNYDDLNWTPYASRRTQIVAELKKSGWLPDAMSEAEGSEHLAKALSSFREAMKLAPKNALYQLGFASLMERASAWAHAHPKASVPAEVRQLNRSNILNEYKKAWEMELSADLKDREERGMFSPMDMVSYEAGSAYVRLAERDKPSLTVVEQKLLEKIRASLVDLEKNNGRAITPLILSTRAVRGIDDLLAPEASVAFPLRGWGPDGRWTWLKPDTALLVWNPGQSGKIATGAQLFGGYTWELFWNNGYEPLAILDADGDTMLRGDELAGIGLWFDRNSNGVSDPGEVQTLAEAGITGLSTKPNGNDGIHPMNTQGVIFSDGRSLPTWDWMASPAPAQP